MVFASGHRKIDLASNEFLESIVLYTRPSKIYVSIVSKESSGPQKLRSSQYEGVLGFMGFIGFIGVIGFIGFIGVIGFIGLGLRVEGTKQHFPSHRVFSRQRSFVRLERVLRGVITTPNLQVFIFQLQPPLLLTFKTKTILPHMCQ